MQEAGGSACDDGGADAAAPSPILMPYANVDVVNILQQAAASADADTDEDDVAMDDFLPPEPASPENDDASTTAGETTATVEPLIVKLPDNAELDDEGPTQEEPVDTPSTSQDGAMTTTTAMTADTGDASNPTEESVNKDVKSSWAGAIPKFMQKLQEKKDELVDGTHYTRIVSDGSDGFADL